jgi:assimilatory nitrate reductase catalytic subunit
MTRAAPALRSSPTPLCPAGHLPLKGGDQPTAWISPIVTVAEWAELATRVISPLEGEMSDRTEGGRCRIDCLSVPSRAPLIPNQAVA